MVLVFVYCPHHRTYHRVFWGGVNTDLMDPVAGVNSQPALLWSERLSERLGARTYLLLGDVCQQALFLSEYLLHKGIIARALYIWMFGLHAR